MFYKMFPWHNMIHEEDDMSVWESSAFRGEELSRLSCCGDEEIQAFPSLDPGTTS